jgi:anti-sigma factor RsiW
MPRPGPDDLLSAYFDREVTPTERAAAEQLLESDVAARQELEEIGGLSDLLKSLPSEAAPDFLLPATLQRAEREALFAHAAAAPVAVASPRRRREWLVVLAGLLTTSAAVLLMVNTLPQAEHAPVGSLATEYALVDFDSATPEVAAKSENAWHFGKGKASPATVADGVESRSAAFKKLESEGLAESARGFGGGAAPPARVGGDRQNSFMLRTDPAPLAPATRFAAPANEPLSASTTPLALPGVMNFSDAPADAMFAYRGLQEAAETNFGTVAANNSIRLGQVIPYLAMNRDGAMTVIEFTVIDVDQAADSLEVLLSRNDIKPQSGEKAVDEKLAENRPVSDKTRLNGLARKQSGDRSENLVAFYVQTGPELAGRMIRQLESEPWVVKVDLMPPVPGDDLIRESTPVDARQIEEALVRNGIQYGNTAMQNSAGQGFGGARGSLEPSGSGIAAASRPETSLGVALADRRRASGNDNPTQSGAQELQVMQRFELRQRPEVVQLLGDNVAETSKPASDNPQKDRNLEGRLTEKRLAASSNIRMLFILQQNDLPGVAPPTIPAPRR